MPLSALLSILVDTAPSVLAEGENLGHKKSTLKVLFIVPYRAGSQRKV